MNFQTALNLGRISNLPTVWSNVLAGMVLAGVQTPPVATVILLLASCSLMYVGGMYLNDAFDAEIDTKERADRPIPRGEVSRALVMVLGFGMLALGLLLLAGFSNRTLVTGGLLAAAILFYNWYHKNNPLSPVVMGLCRFLVFGLAGYAVTTQPDMALLWGALAVWSYVIGLTYVARQENLNQIGSLWPLVFLVLPVGFGVWHAPDLWGVVMLGLFAGWAVYALTFLAQDGRNVPKSVVSLIAGISLLDASLMMLVQAYGPAILAFLCFLATIAGQRSVRGT